MRISRIGLSGALVCAALSLASGLPAAAVAEQTGTMATPRVANRVNDDSCGDDSVCFYRYTHFHDKILELEFPEPGECYNLDHEATSVINNLRGTVRMSARPFCFGDDHRDVNAGVHEEGVPPRRSFMLL